MQCRDAEVCARARQDVHRRDRLCVWFLRAGGYLLLPRLQRELRGVQRTGHVQLRQRQPGRSTLVHDGSFSPHVQRLLQRKHRELHLSHDDRVPGWHVHAQ